MTLPRCLGTLSMLAYVLSFVAPYEGEYGGGGFLFFVGLVYCWWPPLSFAWWANVLYWLALGNAERGRWGRTAVWAVPATTLASSFLLLDEYRNPAVKSPAFWMWVASMALLAAAGLAGWLMAAVRAIDAADPESE